MIKAVQDCFRKYAIFSGRSDRSEYWYFYLFCLVVIFLAGNANSSDLLILADMIFIIPLYAAGVRRLHDVNKSGWFLLVPFYSLYLLCMPSDGINKYGPPPQGITPLDNGQH